MVYKLIRFLANLYVSIYYKIVVSGLEKVPEEGALLISANHIHWADPILVACKIPNRHISYLGKKELFDIKPLGWLLRKIDVIPVHRGANDVKAIKNSLRALKNEDALGIFPEGTRMKAGERKPVETGFVTLALKTQAQIVPVGIKGSYRFREKIEIKIGDPILLQNPEGRKRTKDEIHEMAEEVMDTIRELAK
ncbi:MAG TPA: 1-acyl-sn-glycerol-3-phosphate acyltransferase [Eubacteriaceae bacterium]|nr:1-acyl-sn-glycerol-3-phosphate acyltransferase [Eubacteriaceae bacterium]